MNPGPIIYGPQGEQIADLRADLLPREERTANLRLIAAAPELLAALEEIAGWDPEAHPNEPGGMSIMDAIDTARAAIAKATGRPA